jgi:two-component sensor histidine kinase/PAS domain-containing protein
MPSRADIPADLPPDVAAHLANVADNLQLVADMGYGDVALALLRPDGKLEVVADARPNTAVAPIASTRVGSALTAEDVPEAFEALQSEAPVFGLRRRVARGISYTTSAYPILSSIRGVIVRDIAIQVAENPGTMETRFMDAAEELLEVLTARPIEDLDGGLFATTRTAGDGVLRVGPTGQIAYASPNAVTIMRLGGIERVLGTPGAELPGGGQAIARVANPGTAAATQVEVVGRSLSYRTIGLPAGALVLVEDVTEARRREAELKVKDATIREVHHRVKNNLQTIASLLRIQARRTGSEEARHALAEATERVSSMAVVHDLLAGADEEHIDFGEAARMVVELVRRGLLGESSAIRVSVEGTTGMVDAHTATSLALALAELVHNAIEHGFGPEASGSVLVQMRRSEPELVISVRDDGCGMPEGFDAKSSAGLGLAIVRTVVSDDLRGTLSFTGGKRGTTVTVRVPLADKEG